ncbi:MAG TPA: PGPGW domain-containing protein [Chondromyces sp.]|nr:PGPGW domain-containing protein [Chondromyces sp.]
MSDIVSLVREHQPLLEWLGGVSLLLFIVTLAVFPLVIVFLPQDYFVRHRRDPAHRTRRHPVVWWALTIVKNALGIVLVLAGLAMLVLPGQGLLTILIGVTLVNFPGKYTLERRLVSRPRVAGAIQRIRGLAGRPRLEIPTAGEVSDRSPPDPPRV